MHEQPTLGLMSYWPPFLLGFAAGTKVGDQILLGKWILAIPDDVVLNFFCWTGCNNVRCMKPTRTTGLVNNIHPSAYKHHRCWWWLVRRHPVAWKSTCSIIASRMRGKSSSPEHSRHLSKQQHPRCHPIVAADQEPTACVNPTTLNNSSHGSWRIYHHVTWVNYINARKLQKWLAYIDRSHPISWWRGGGSSCTDTG